MTISERWQQEVAETVFEAINQDTDKLEQKRKQKPRIDDVDLGNSSRNYKHCSTFTGYITLFCRFFFLIYKFFVSKTLNLSYYMFLIFQLTGFIHILLNLFFSDQTDCIVEGEVLKLGGPFLQTWQKKHLKLYPNRLEFYHKNRDGQITRAKVEVLLLTSLFIALLLLWILFYC